MALPEDLGMYILIVKLKIIFPAISIPLFNSSRCHSSWQTRTKASRSTFPLSSCLPHSHCHAVTHVTLSLMPTFVQ